MNLRILSVFALLSAVVLTSVPATAAIDNVDRPTVGLVLGGGGARGGAHIGVLRELERLRIPVDAIAGTSMGAIVGGLYASGTSVAELEQIVSTLDWSAAFSNSPQRKKRTISPQTG